MEEETPIRWKFYNFAALQSSKLVVSYPIIRDIAFVSLITEDKSSLSRTIAQKWTQSCCKRWKALKAYVERRARTSST